MKNLAAVRVTGKGLALGSDAREGLSEGANQHGLCSPLGLSWGVTGRVS